MKVEISDYMYQKCKEFAIKRCKGSSDIYARRGESRTEKMIEDIVIGTTGEYAVQKYFKDKGYYCSKPDLTIYDKKRKSFDADLFVTNGDTKYKIHVKSQGETSRKRYGSSWLLQRRDKLVSEPKEDEFFAFTCVKGKEVEILGIVACKDIVDNDLLSECRVPRYRHSKVALYFDEIRKELKTRKLRRL